MAAGEIKIRKKGKGKRKNEKNGLKTTYINTA